AGADVDDAHAVGEMVHHPDLGVRAGRHRDGLHPDRHRARVREATAAHVEDLEPVVRRIDREELGPARREGQRPHLTALEGDEGLCPGERRAEQGEDPSETKCRDGTRKWRPSGRWDHALLLGTGGGETYHPPGW